MKLDAGEENGFLGDFNGYASLSPAFGRRRFFKALANKSIYWKDKTESRKDRMTIEYKCFRNPRLDMLLLAHASENLRAQHGENHHSLGTTTKFHEEPINGVGK